MKRNLLVGVLALFLIASGCGKKTAEVSVICTIGPLEAGLMEELGMQFGRETGLKARFTGAGSGKALARAEAGGFDMVIVHARTLEEDFVRRGFGRGRVDLMYNDFFLMGPAADPAGVRGQKNVLAALRRIASLRRLFLSRGDRSGTHMAEMRLWKEAGVKPAGSWYRTYEKGAEGNVSTLRQADRLGAYTLIDRATVTSLGKEIRLAVLRKGDAALLNFFTLILVSPQKIKNVREREAALFADWLTDPEKGQRIIRDFRKGGSPVQLFFPNSLRWREREGETRP